LNFSNRKLIIFSLISLFGVAFAGNVFAAWNGLPFQPGTENNPPCLPSQTNCDVVPPLTTETEPLYAGASTSILFFGTSSDALTEGLSNKFYTDSRVANYIGGSSTLSFQNFSAGRGTTTSLYANSSLGLNNQYISSWSDLSAFLPAVAGWSTSSDSLNFNSLLDAKNKDYFFSTSSADNW